MTIASGVLFVPAAQAANPIACFTQSPSNPDPNEAVTFDSTCSHDVEADGRIASRAWDLDNDGAYDDGTGVTASRTFTAPGRFTVRLRVKDGSNNTDTETQTVIVNAPPSASFTNSPASPSTGTAVTFTSTSTDSDGTIAAYAWDLDNDGAFDDGTTASVSQTFATPGDRTVKLRVTDNGGAQDTETRTIAIANRAPTVSITSNPASPLSGQTFTLTASAGDPDGSVASYAWDVDGNGTDNFTTGTTTKTASFAAPGTYPVKVRVTDNNGGATVATLQMIIGNRAPTVSIASNPASPQTGETFTLTATAADVDGSIASYAWDVDGNGTDNFAGGSATKTAKFSALGTYPMKVRVTDNSGTSTVSTLNVTVGNKAPLASFTRSIANPQAPVDITFTSTSTDPDGTIVAYAWDTDADGIFDDGTGPTSTRKFTNPGNKYVALRVTDNHGAVSLAEMRWTMGNRLPTAQFTVSNESPVAGDAVTLTSTASDLDGRIVTQKWDLDQDGQYDDATGSTATVAPTTAGTYRYGLSVVDDFGGTASVTKTVTFSAKPGEPPIDPNPPGGEVLPPPESNPDGTFDTSTPVTPTPPTTPVVPDPPTVVAPLRYIDPFPVVRMRGRTTPKGAQLSMFTVRAPHGSLVTITCKGGGCPAKSMSAKIKTKSKHGSATVHFKRLERFLRAGIELEVSVTHKGMVGKYTRIRIRKLAVPVRSDRCLLPDSPKPTACPKAP